MRLSSSVRVSRTSDWKPGRSTGTTVAVSAESRSLASLLSSRRRASDPTAAVPAGSALLASAIAGDDVIEHGLVDLVAGKVCVPYSFADGREVRARVGERDAGSAAAEVDERDDTAGGQSGRRLQRGERGDRVRYERGGHAVGREAAACRAALRAGRRRPPGPSARAPRWPRVRRRPPCGPWRRGPRRARRSPRWELPSSATSGTGSPTRSTKPVKHEPGLVQGRVLARAHRPRVRDRGTASTPRGASREAGRRALRPGSSSRWTTRESRSCIPPVFGRPSR